MVSFYNEFQEKGIEVTTDFVDEHVIVHANSEALQRIAQNLLKNILLHGSQEVRISLKREGEEMVFSCSNKVKEDRHIDVSQVFSRFYKSDPARTHSSTGLGLAIAKSLAERMNGTMEARMEDGWFSISMTMRAKNV